MQRPEMTEEQYQQLIERTAELQQAYAALAEREAQYRTIVETANEGIWMLDVNAHTTFVNRRMTEMLGYSEAEMLGRGLYDFMDESVRAETEQKFARRLAGKSDRHECQFRRKDGSILWALVSATSLFDHQNRVIGALGMLTDVTERRRNDQALRESQTRNQLAMNVASMFAFEWDVISDLVWRSSHCAPLLGLSINEAEHDTGQNFFHRIHPDDRQGFVALLQGLTPEQTTYTATYRFINPTGKVFILEESAQGFFEDGRLVRLIGMTKDVTAREQTAISLRQSEYQLRLITEAIPHQIWTARPDGNVDYLNHRWFEYTGYTVEQLQDQGWAAIVHPNDLQQVTDSWQQSVATGNAYRIEARLRSSDGTYRWFLGQAILLRDEQGQPIKWYGSNTDIHDRKQAEEALHKSTAILNTINESTPTLIFVKDRQGRFVMANPAALQILGKSASEVIGKTNAQLLPNPTEAEAITINDRQVMETGMMQIFEEASNFPGGRRTYLSIKSPYRDEQGNIIGLIGISTDISDRKQAEEALRQSEVNFRTLANSMPQIFWTAQPNGAIDYYNQRWYEYTGMTFEQSQGEGWQLIVHPDDLTVTLQQWQAAVRTGSQYEIEYRFKHVTDGQYRWHLGRAFPLRDENGTILKWFGSSTDIHDQKQALAERDQALERECIAREQAEAANRIKDEFLAVLSHELRTPLNPILGWAKLLQSRSFPPDQTQQALATIERNAKLQVQLIDDLLDISRIIRGKFTLELAPVSLIEPIMAALETVQLSAKAKAIEIKTLLNPQVGVILGDVNRLQQVVWNLLSNAIKFTTKGGTITIWLERVDDLDPNYDSATLGVTDALPLTYAQIQISDTGKGINPAFLPHVFELFRQQDSSTTRQFGGLGLGLAIVRQVVEAHGGTIVADSPGEGQGATFTIRLPLLQTSTSSEASDLQSQSPLSLQGIQILVIDDELDSLELIKLILEQEGANVTTVMNAKTALQTLAQASFDLMI
ncbi:MAG TPA: PAS domain S-box protein, partial [Microcoleaceae cyanobacterium]